MKSKEKITNEQARHIIDSVLEETEIIGRSDNDCDSYVDITEEAKQKLAEYIKKFVDNDEEVCSECFCIINDEDYIGHSEARTEIGSEYIVTGYKCHNCGHQEEY